MSSTGYSRGRDAEYRAVNELKELGYDAVRTAGSHGHVDVIAWNDDHTRFIQIKTWLGRRPSFAKETGLLRAIHAPPACSIELWGRRSGQDGWDFQNVVKEHAA